MTADSLADVESARISLRVGRTDALYPKIPYRRETVIMFSGCTVIVCGQEASSIRLSAFGINNKTRSAGSPYGHRRRMVIFGGLHPRYHLATCASSPPLLSAAVHAVKHPFGVRREFQLMIRLSSINCINNILLSTLHISQCQRAPLVALPLLPSNPPLKKTSQKVSHVSAALSI